MTLPAVTVTSTPDAFYAVAAMLMHSLSRGDFDEDPDFENESAYVSGLLVSAADAARENTCTQVIDAVVLDDVLSIAESDTQPSSAAALDRFIIDANAALAHAGASN